MSQLKFHAFEEDASEFYDPDIYEPSHRERILIVGQREYVNKIWARLDYIHCSQMGEAVLNEIFGAPSGRQVRIISTPGTGSGQAISVDDPATREDEHLDAWATGVVPDPARPHLTGTGRGCSSELRMDIVTTLPGAFCHGSVCPPNPMFNEPVFVLFHELVHSMRQLNGKYQLGFATMNGREVEIEEGIAILITNVLMSEKGLTALRADHTTLDTVGTDPFVSLARHDGVAIVKAIKRDHPLLFRRMASQGRGLIPFNPFRALDEIERLARSHSTRRAR